MGPFCTLIMISPRNEFMSTCLLPGQHIFFNFGKRQQKRNTFALWTWLNSCWLSVGNRPHIISMVICGYTIADMQIHFLHFILGIKTYIIFLLNKSGIIKSHVTKSGRVISWNWLAYIESFTKELSVVYIYYLLFMGPSEDSCCAKVICHSFSLSFSLPSEFPHQWQHLHKF